MKIVIPGGTGQVGTVLSRAFHAAGHEVIVLSRSPVKAPWCVAHWNGESLGEWAKELEGADAVINLAGRSVNCRYHEVNRREIVDSRVKSTRVVGQAIAQCAQPPRVWLQASTATYYAHRYDAPNDDFTGIIGGKEVNVPETWRFSISVAEAWERAFSEATVPGVRKVLMRTSIVMNPDSGSAFTMLLRLVRFGLGGQSGNGKQFVSWIHDRDFTRAVTWLIEQSKIEGPVILAAPDAIPNAEFMRELREAWGINWGLPATEWMLEIGTFLLHTESELVLKSRRVHPARLLAAGFGFEFPTWPEAARDLCERWREMQKKG